MSESTPVQSKSTTYLLGILAAVITILGLTYALLSGTEPTTETPVVETPVVVETTPVLEIETTVVIPVSEENATPAAEITVTAPAVAETPEQ